MRKRRFSDAWLAVGILIILFVVIAAGVLLTPNRPNYPPLSSRSTQKDGSLALYVWLARLGYQESNDPGSDFAVPLGTDAVFLLEPDPYVPVQEEEWKALDQFIQNGGILVAAGESYGSAQVASHYGFSLSRDGYNHYIVGFTPVLHSPPLDFSKINLLAFNYLDRSTFDYLPVLVENNHPYAVELPKGKGKVILVADSALFNNLGLKQTGAPELLLNLLAPIPRGAKVWFDEWHHGERSIETTRSGLEDWLLYTPAGQAILWVLLLAFVGLALQGRYFGRPLGAENDRARRAPLEFVNAMASLNQRASHRTEILHGYYRQLKRSLSQRYRIDPDLPDNEIARILSETHPEIDPSALPDLFKRLKLSSPSEQDMVALAHQAAEWIQKIEQSSSGSSEKKKE